MGRLETKKLQAAKRRYRVRSKVFGTKEVPRLAINISNRHIRAQLIDDTTSSTLVFVTTAGNKSYDKMNFSESAKTVGTEIAKLALAKKIKKVVLDRGSLKYHGRIKTLAETARENGLEI